MTSFIFCFCPLVIEQNVEKFLTTDYKHPSNFFVVMLTLFVEIFNLILIFIGQLKSMSLV